MFRKKWRVIVQILSVFLLPNLIYADCIKEIQYRVLEEKIQALEAGSDIHALNVLDLLQGKSALQLTQVSICIDQSGYITKTSIYSYGQNTFYPNRIHKTIETSTGMEAFDKEGVLITSILHDATEIVDIPGVGFPLTPTQITDFGMTIDLQTLIPVYQTQYTSFGGSYWNVGSKYFFNAPTHQSVVAPNALYYLNSQYDENGQIKGMQLATYNQKNELLLPQFVINQEYAALSDGSLLQTTFKETYLDYSILENGVMVLAHKEQEHPYYHNLPQSTDDERVKQTSFSSFERPKMFEPQVEVFPNPAIDQVQIALNGLWQGKNVQWDLSRMDGQRIMSGEKMADQERIQLSVEALSSGMYFFKMEHEGSLLSKKIIISN